MNEKKLIKIFCESLDIPENRIDKNLEYQSIPEWDSVGHMKLAAAIDETFEIMLDTDDVLDMSSFEKAKEILKKYEIEFE